MTDKVEVLIWDGDEGPILVRDATRDQLLVMVEHLYKEIKSLRKTMASTNETWRCISDAQARRSTFLEDLFK